MLLIQFVLLQLVVKEGLRSLTDQGSAERPGLTENQRTRYERPRQPGGRSVRLKSDSRSFCGTLLR